METLNKETKHVKYTKGYKYQLVEDYSIQTSIKPYKDMELKFISLSKDGLLTIKAGYASDGPSGPTIDTKNSIRGAFVHDALYQLIRQRCLPKSVRPQCDELAYRIWIEDGMYKWRAKLWKRELGKFAGYAADPKNAKETLTAP